MNRSNPSHPPPTFLKQSQNQSLFQAEHFRPKSCYLFLSCLLYIILFIPVDVHGLTALHSATLTDNSDLVQKLLDHEDIQPNIEDKKGFTPVMSASFKGKTNALKVTDKKKVILTDK